MVASSTEQQDDRDPYFDNDVNQSLREAYSTLLGSRGYTTSIKISPLYTQIQRHTSSETNNLKEDRGNSCDPDNDDDGREGVNHETDSMTQLSNASLDSFKRHITLEGR